MSQAPPDEPTEPQETAPAAASRAPLASTPPPQAPLPSAPVHKRLQVFFSALDKQVRGHRMYRGEGAVVEQLAQELVGLAAELLADGAVTVRVTPFGLSREGKPVTDPAVRIPYLFRMYLDGVRELTLLPRLDRGQLDRLVRLLATDARDDEDMVTLLWSARIEAVRAYAVDRFGAGAQGSGKGGGEQGFDALATTGRGLGLAAGGRGAEVALSADDVRVMRTDAVAAWVRDAETRESAEDDPHAPAVAALRDALRLQRDPARFVSVAAQASGPGTGRTITASPLALGVLDGLVMAEDAPAVATFIGRLAQPDVDHDPALAALRTAVFEPERAVLLAPLVQAEPERFLPVLTALTASVQEGLVALLTALPGDAPGAAASDTPSARLQRVLDDAGVDMTRYWAERLQSEDEAEVLRAIAALGQLSTPRAAAALQVALASTLGTIRRAALSAMLGSYDQSVRDTLGRLLRDPDRENRLMAAEILAESGDVQAARQLVRVMQEAAFRGRDQAERIALMQALARFRDPRTTPLYAALLEQRTAVGGKAEVPVQLAAVDALAEMPGAEAKRALELGAGRWLVAREVKERIAAALARRPGEAP